MAKAAAAMDTLTHSGRVNTRDCPTPNCPGKREARIVVTFKDGRQRVITGCDHHVELWFRAFRGNDPPVRRCIP